MHPHHAARSAADCEALRALLGRPEVVAVGECGLDFNRNFSPQAAQRRLLRRAARPWPRNSASRCSCTSATPATHSSASCASTGRSCRRPWSTASPAARAQLDAYLDLDLHIGITGWICDERRGLHLRGCWPVIPRDRLMLETDAPYLLPRTMPPPPRDRRNEPAFLPYVLDAVAAALGRPEAELAAETTATARAFFGLP